MGDYYILNADHSVRRPAGLREWADAFNAVGTRRVARDRIGDAEVSTVFLGIDHSFGQGPPLIFETMIFGGQHDQDQWRYSTWDEAVAGHQAAVELVRSDETPTLTTTGAG